MFKDYYKILGIISDATSEEIKKAYRSQSMRWHPDRNPGMDTTAKMQDINEAYNILKDPATKARYDAEYAKFNSARYKQPSTMREEPVYDIKDETLKEDIKEARKAAEDYVREFYASLKNDSKNAARGAWEGAKGYVVGGIIMTIIALIVKMCISSQSAPTIQETTSSTYSNSSQTATSSSNEKVRLKTIPPMEKEEPKHWKDQTFFNAFKISVPITVERQTKDSPYGRDLANKGMLQLRDDLIIFNQKGLCDLKPGAKDQYCRIMINYMKEVKGDFLQRDETEPFDWEYDQLLEEMVKNEIGSGSRLIGTFSREWVHINNANAILVAYRRTGNNYDTSKPVCCKVLLFQDDYRFVKMMISYREEEANLWANDFEQVMRSFEWINQ